MPDLILTMVCLQMSKTRSVLILFLDKRASATLELSTKGARNVHISVSRICKRQSDYGSLFNIHSMVGAHKLFCDGIQINELCN